MKSVNYYCNRIATLIENGRSADESVSIIISELKNDKSRIKIPTILKEFRLLYDHSIYHYEFKYDKTNYIDENMIQDLTKEFLNYEKNS